MCARDASLLHGMFAVGRVKKRRFSIEETKKTNMGLTNA
jgi:hypothetical protein